MMMPKITNPVFLKNIAASHWLIFISQSPNIWHGISLLLIIKFTVYIDLIITVYEQR